MAYETDKMLEHTIFEIYDEREDEGELWDYWEQVVCSELYAEWERMRENR